MIQSVVTERKEGWYLFQLWASMDPGGERSTDAGC